MGRAPCCGKMGLKTGPWSPEEDDLLVAYIKRYGHPNWRALPKQAEVGKGTSVKIHLPASELPVKAATSTTVERSPSGDGRRLLVVEDDPMVRRMVVRGLTDHGFEVVDCARAKQAFDLLGNPDELFDLLLTDVVMPDVDGGELARRAAQLRPALPVLFMSGYSDLNLQQLDHPTGELSLIEKPFSVLELLSAVTQVIERERV